MNWIVSLFKNPIATLVVLGGVIMTGLAFWVQALRLDKERVKRDLAEGEAKAVRNAVNAANKEKSLTSELLEENEKNRANNNFTDIK